MRNNYRGLFWPGLLILAGVVALLANAGVISTDRLGLLFDLWPVILIVIGVELILRRALSGPTGEVAAVLIVLIAVGGALLYVALAPNPGTTHSLDVSAPVGTFDRASLEIDAGASTITLAGDSSDTSRLYSAHIEYSGSKPGISLDNSNGNLRISQGTASIGMFQSHHFVIRLLMNPRLPWTISVNSGASTDTFKLGTVNVQSISVNTGASREDITLGRPSGIVPISVDGGALTVHFHRPVGVPVSASVSGGAVSLDGDGEQHRGIGSQSWLSSGFDGATDGYKIDVNGGACTVTVDTTPAAA